MKLFIPLEDKSHALLHENDRLVPYQAGMALFSQLEILTPQEAAEEEASTGRENLNQGPAAKHPPVEPPIRRLCRR